MRERSSGISTRAWTQRFVRYVIALFATLAMTAASDAQSIRFVRSDAPVGGNGMSWATAYRKVFHALDEAAVNSAITQIWIAQGTHTPNRGSGNRDDAFVLAPNVTLYGGFVGDETSLDQRDPKANPTILSGDFNGNDGPAGTFTSIAENARHVVTALNFTQQAATLDGLTVRGGNADFNPDLLLGGGGLFVQSARVEIVGCTFIANSAGINEPSIGGFGGAIYNFGGDVDANDCLFTINRGDSGGAIGVREFNDTSTYRAAFTHCRFIANKAEHQTGGAVWTGANPFDTVERELTFNSCLFQDNIAQYGGAIIEQNTKHVRLHDCTFQNNEAFVVGGAMWLSQTAGIEQEPAFITRCTFLDNEGADAGGALFCTAADALITSCQFLGNAAPNGTGGAIRSGPQFGASFGAGDLALYNCVFAGNSAQFVGAVAALRNPLARIVNCTVANNTAATGPGGVFSDAFNLQIDNTILWQNAGAGTTQAAQLTHVASFGPLTINRSCVQGLDGSLGGAGNIGDNPMFVDVDGADNLPGTLDDNARLLESSPAIDTADAAALPADVVDLDGDNDFIEPLPLDLDGNPRVAGRALDMGAFEFPKPAASGDVNGDGVVDVNDLLAVIGAWGACPAPPMPCPADISPAPNGDGVVNVNDLLLVIGNWS